MLAGLLGKLASVLVTWATVGAHEGPSSRYFLLKWDPNTLKGLVSMNLIHVWSFTRVPPRTIWQTMGREKKSLKEEKQQVVLQPATHMPSALKISVLLLSLSLSQLQVYVSHLLRHLHHCCCCCFFWLWHATVHRGEKILFLCTSNHPLTSLLMTCQLPRSSIFCPINSFLPFRKKGRQ